VDIRLMTNTAEGQGQPANTGSATSTPPSM